MYEYRQLVPMFTGWSTMLWFTKDRYFYLIWLGSWYTEQSNLGNYSCKSTNCFVFKENKKVTINTNHGYLGYNPIKTDPRQVNIAFLFENPGETFIGEKGKSNWDLQMSFRRLNQDMFLPISYINSNIIIFKTRGKSFNQRTNNLSIFISNGSPRNNRNEILFNLSKY